MLFCSSLRAVRDGVSLTDNAILPLVPTMMLGDSVPLHILCCSAEARLDSPTTSGEDKGLTRGIRFDALERTCVRERQYNDAVE